MPRRPIVAVIDDDDSMRVATSNLLEAAGYATKTFSSAECFLGFARRRSVSCVVTDVRMPGMTGLELFESLVASGSGIPTVLVTAYPDDAVRRRARKEGLFCYLSKPFSPEELCACVEAAVASRAIPKA